MTQVTGTGIKNVAGDIAATGTVTISTKPRMSGAGAYIDGRSKKSSIVAGAMTALEIEPGPVKVAVSVGSSYDTFDAIVPETGPVTLAALKEQTYTYEPPVVSQVQAYKTAAEAAATEAADILEQVEGGAVPDALVAAHVESGTSETRTALNSIYATPAQITSAVSPKLDASTAATTYAPITRATVSGFTDAAITTALNSGASYVYFPAGTYNITSQFTIPLAVTCIELHPGATIIQNSDSTVFVRARTSAPSPVAITSGATEGSRSVVVSSTSGLTAGDYALLTSEDLITGGATSRRGMMRRIESISGTTVTLDSPLHRDLTTTPQIRMCNLRATMTLINNGTIRQADGILTTAVKNLITFSFTDRGKVFGSGTFGPCGAGGIQFDHCLAPVVDGPNFIDLGLSGMTDPGDGDDHRRRGHAIIWSGSTRDARVISGSATRVRHGVTTLPGGDDSAYGEPENFVVEAGYAVRNTAESGLDTHEQGYGGIFRPNVDSCFQGIQSRARGLTIEGGVVRNSVNWGLLVRSTSSDTRSTGTRFVNSSATNTVAGAVLTYSTLSLQGAVVDGFGSNAANMGIQATGAGAVRAEQVRILGRGSAGKGVALSAPGSILDGVNISDVAVGVSETAGTTGNDWANLSFTNVPTKLSVQTYSRSLDVKLDKADAAATYTPLALASSPLVPGLFYTPARTGATAATITADFAKGGIIPVGRTCTLTSIAVEVTTAGSVGAVVRLGVYRVNLNTMGLTLIADAGTVDATSTGVKTASISAPVTIGDSILVVGAVQGGATTQPALRLMSGGNPAIGSTAASVISTTILGLQFAAAGALPSTATGSIGGSTALPIIAVSAAA